MTTAADSPPPRPKVARNVHPEAWAQARILRAQGLTWSEIAHQTGLAQTALRARGSREKWVSSILAHTTKAVNAALSPLTAHAEVCATQVTRSMSQMSQRATEWVERVAKLRERHLDALEARPAGDLSLDDLETAGRIAEGLDRPMRRNLGLDRENDQIRVSVGLYGTVGPAPAPVQVGQGAESGQIVDVESTAQASSGDHE